MPSTSTQRVAFFGTPAIAIPALEWLHRHDYSVPVVVTQPDRPVGRKHRLTPSPIKRSAHERGIFVLEPERITTDWIRNFAAYQPDVALLVAYGKILPPELLAIPRLGFLNIHASLLPALRGPSPIQSAIWKGLQKTGLTLQKISEGMDQGDVFGSLSVSVHERETAGSLEEKLTVQIQPLLDHFFADAINGRINATPQDHTRATYCKMIHDIDGRIDWKKSAIELDRQIRALNPNPGTFTFRKDHRVKLLRASVSSGVSVQRSLRPGELRFDNGKVVVGTGNGTLELEVLQPAGKQPLSSTEFTQGYRAYNGALLG